MRREKGHEGTIKITNETEGNKRRKSEHLDGTTKHISS